MPTRSQIWRWTAVLAAGPSRTSRRKGPQQESSRNSRRPLRIRARYRGGVFIPASAVEIPEGANVEMEVRISKNS